jgi:hypothetical protein
MSSILSEKYRTALEEVRGMVEDESDIACVIDTALEPPTPEERGEKSLFSEETQG